MIEVRMFEGINDQNLFKAVLLAGGPGSGKSFIVGNVFGVKNNMTPFGQKVINSDDILAPRLLKMGLPLVFDPNTPIYQKQMVQREISKYIAIQRQNMWLAGMLPIIIDGTGKNFENMKLVKAALENVGYDVDLIFVDTSLDVALQRNIDRGKKPGGRTVPEEIVIDSWNKVQNNKKNFSTLFGSQHFFIINNSKTITDPAEFKNFTYGLYKLGAKIMNRPLQNSLGNTIIDALRRIGGKYLTDLPLDIQNDLDWKDINS